MSSITHSDELVTKTELSQFYQAIYPYLGNSAYLGYTPVGTIISVMGTTAPNNYLACNGQVVNISDYRALADYFEEQFGSKNYFGGNGTTTFGIPDLRGEFLRGTGTNSHTNQGSGANVGTHQDATELPPLYAWVSSNGTQASFGLELKNKTASQYGNKEAKADSGINNEVGYITTSAVNITERTTADASFTTRPTNTSVLYCIATKNIYIDINPSQMGIKTQSANCLVGDTTCTITDTNIHTTSEITPYFDNASETSPANWHTTTTEGQCVLTFNALTEATVIYLKVVNY